LKLSTNTVSNYLKKVAVVAVVVVMVAVEIAAATVAVVAVATVVEVLSAAVDAAVDIQVEMVAVDAVVVIRVEMVAVVAHSLTIDLLATVHFQMTDLLVIDLLAIDLLTIPIDLQTTDHLLIATDQKDLLESVLLMEVDLLETDLLTATELLVATNLSVVIKTEAILDHSVTTVATVALKEKFVKKLKRVKVLLSAIAATATAEIALLLGETITVALNHLQVHLATEVVTVDKARKLQVLATSAEILQQSLAKTQPGIRTN
jgi:hypothetical protein